MTAATNGTRRRPSALDRLTLLAREELAARNMALTDPDGVRRVVVGVVDGYQRLAAMGQEVLLTDPEGTAVKIIRRVTSLGPFDELLAPNSPNEDIFIEGSSVRVFADGKVRALKEAISEDEALRVVNQLLSETDATLDRAHPVVDGVQVLGGRARLSAAIPPVSPHLTVSIRLYTNRFANIVSLEGNDTLSTPAAVLLSLDVQAKGSILIGGETGSGKSTLMASLLAAARTNHNVRLVEESRELQFRPEFGGRLQCAPGARDHVGSGADTLRDLIKLSLRMKPDVLAVGEVRGEEAWELARASRVGAGFLTTIHANSAEDTLEALVLTALGAGENIQERLVRRTFGRSIDLVVFCERDDPNVSDPDGAYLHQVTEIRALIPMTDDGAFSSEPIFLRADGIGSPMEWTKRLPPTDLVRRLERQLPFGVTLHDVLTGKVDPR